MKSGLGAGKTKWLLLLHSRPVYMFLAFTYIIIVYFQTQFDLLFSIIMNCIHLFSVMSRMFCAFINYVVNVYENLTCSICAQLNSPAKTWKMDINGPGKSWKTTTTVLHAPFLLDICLR